MFSPDGSFYTEFGLQPDPAQAGEDLEFPQGVAVAATGQVWVADTGHDRIVQFGRVPGPPAAGAPVAPRRAVTPADHRRGACWPCSSPAWAGT